jgi:hypothetical protein
MRLALYQDMLISENTLLTYTYNNFKYESWQIIVVYRFLHELTSMLVCHMTSFE